MRRSDPIDLTALRRWFDPDGAVGGALAAYERRVDQVAMAEAVAGVVNDGGILLVEAGTGTGKTIGYLAPVLAAGLKAIVSTGTKTLQQQLIERDLPFLARCLPVDFRAVALKGRGNYLCKLRFDSRRRERDLFDDDAEWARVRRWARTTRRGDRAELTDLPEDFTLWRDVASSTETCVAGDCPHYEQCFALGARRRALKADVVVVNHHLLFADLAVRDQFDTELLPSADVLILDEAHQLEDTACQFFGARTSTGKMNELAREVSRVARAFAAEREKIALVINRLQESAARLFGAFELYGHGRTRLERDSVPADGVSAYHQLDNVLENLTVRLERLGEKSETALSLARRIAEARAELNRLLEFEEADAVYWVERQRRFTALQMSPIDAAPIFRDHLLSAAASIVFTSATLTTAGDFGFYRRRLGLPDHAAELALPPGFDYQRQALIYLPTHLPDPRDGEFNAAAAEEILRLLELTRGRAFVLFTSYAGLRACREYLEGRLPYRILVQGERPRDALLMDFRADTHSVLLATASFWEGVDVAGESLSCVIIDKLPFASPGDPLLQARLDSVRAHGGHPFFDYQVPAAIVALRQGFGRLIRTAQDRGVVAILDRRLSTMGYGRRFLASLPPCENTGSFDRVRRWTESNLPG